MLLHRVLKLLTAADQEPLLRQAHLGVRHPGIHREDLSWP